MFIPGSRQQIQTDPKAPGPFLIRSLFVLPFPPVTRGVPAGIRSPDLSNHPVKGSAS